MQTTENIKAIKEYAHRWNAVNEKEKEYLRSMTIERKWRQLNAIYLLSKDLGLLTDTTAEEIEVWKRWNELREKLS